MWFQFGVGRKHVQGLEVEMSEAEARSARDKTVRSLWSDSFGMTATRALQTIIVVVLLAGLILGMQQLTVVVIPVLLALILASAFAPVMNWLQKRGVPRLLSTVLVFIVILAILTGVGWLIVWAIRDQADELVEQATKGFEKVVRWIQELPFAPTAEQLAEWQEAVVGFFTSASFGSGALAGLSAVGTFITASILMAVILFFFLKDGPQIWRFLIRPFRGEYRARAKRIGEKTVLTLGSYVRGTAAVAAVDAIGIGLGLWILNVPLALPLSVLVFFLSFIPLVGATLAGILAALVALVSNGFFNALAVVGVVVIVNQLEGNLLQPVLMSRALKLHALVILVALTVGTVLGGIIGAVLSVPVAAVAWGIVQIWNGPDEPAKWARKHPEELAG